MTHPLRILLVEDSKLDAELFLAELRRSGFETDCERVDTEALFREALSSAAWEMVVCDHTLPGFNSSEALRIVRESELDVPFVILSGTIGEEAAVEALKAGARDVVVKSNLARLGPVVDRVLLEAQSRRHQRQLELERTELQAHLHHQAFHDALTGLPNRVLALDRAQQMLARARRQPMTVAALFIDVDGFKQVNDGFGHAAGDELLRQIASRLTRVVRDSETAARLAGDEFVVLVDGAPQLVAERLLVALREPYDMTLEMGRQLSLTASIGIAVGKRETAEELLRDADVALYEAKRAGGNRYVVFDAAMATKTRDLLTVKTDLGKATRRNQLFLLYQPTFDLHTGRPIGVEALIRWRHPERGILRPAKFIPIAEASELIVPIGRWVLKTACRQAAAWHGLGHALGMSVNVSASQIARPDLLQDVYDALNDSGLDPRMLTLEVTEATLMRDAAATAQRLVSLKELGVHIAIDDFGTGYSSLPYLSRSPVDMLKIDRSFINDIGASAEAETLARTLVQVGRSMNIATLGKGIEDTDQLLTLQREHCDLGQGFLLGQPLSAGAIEEFLRQPARIGAAPLVIP
jgi:diguanylate cyclase (GGDEF)-like protein